MTKKYAPHWAGAAPETCDICHAPIVRQFVDGATVRGPWAIMCLPCFGLFGAGIGVGRGQMYERQDAGKWERMDG